MIKIEEAGPDPDEDKDPDYIRRRDWLLERMRKQKWDEPSEPKSTAKRGRKPAPAPVPKIDLNKPRNKFFKFD